MIIAYVLLGRVVEHIYALHEPSESEEYSRKFDDLELQLVKFRLSLPRSSTSVLVASSQNYGYVVWLNAILSTVAILFHHRSTKASPLPPGEDTGDLHWARAVASARTTLQLIKDVTLISMDPLLNAHIPGFLFLAGTILLVEYRTTGDPNLEAVMDIFNLVCDRFNENFPALARKYKAGLTYNLSRDEKGIQQIREAGVRGIITDCTKWKTAMMPVEETVCPGSWLFRPT